MTKVFRHLVLATLSQMLRDRAGGPPLSFER